MSKTAGETHLTTKATSFAVLVPVKSPIINFPISSAKTKRITKTITEIKPIIFLPIL